MIEVRSAPPEHYGWIAERAQLVAGPQFKAIEAVASNGRILGMVGYDGWTPNSCTMHVAIDEPICIRRLIGHAFRLPFLALGRGVVLASVLSTNARSLRLVEHLKFRRVAELRDAWQVGVGLVLFEMRREECPHFRR